MDILERVELLKGKRTIGHFCTLRSEEVIYLAKRKHKDIYKGNNASISEAMTKGEAAWAFDETLLYNLRAKKIERVGVCLVDIGHIYLTALSNYFDGKKTKITEYTGIGSTGARKKCLPLCYFEVTRGSVTLPIAKILGMKELVL